MKAYKNLAGNVGICAYEFRDEEIKIRFHTRNTVVYKPGSLGKNQVEQMKTLAMQGFGLNKYIDEHIREKQVDTLLD